MPDLSTRDQHEKELAALLLILLGQEEDRVRRGIRDGLQFESQLRGAIVPELSAVYLEAAEQLHAQIAQGVPFNRLQWEAEALRWSQQYAQQLAAEIADTTRQGVARARELAKTEGVLLDEAWSAVFSKIRAEMIGITEVTRSITAGERSVAGKFGSGFLGRGIKSGARQALEIIWQTQEDERTCPVCLPLNSKAEWQWSRVFRDGPPAHPRCILPGALVGGRITGALKAFYAGKAVEITSSSGMRLPVTANHPVLTNCGFLSARELREGQYLIRDIGVTKLPSLMSDNKKQPPTRIEDVFASLSKDSQLRSRSDASAIDFHGDEKQIQGNVDVVWPYRVLLTRNKADINKRFSEQRLVRSNVQLLGEPRLCAEHLLQFRVPMLSRGFPGSPALSLNEGAVGFHIRPLDPLLIGSGANACAMGEKVLDQSERLAILSSQSTPSNTALFGKLVDGLPGIVSPDKIVNVRQFDFSGHVYDLATVDGMYYSNGIAVHNCRCYLRYEVR